MEKRRKELREKTIEEWWKRKRTRGKGTEEIG